MRFLSTSALTLLAVGASLVGPSGRAVADAAPPIASAPRPTSIASATRVHPFARSLFGFRAQTGATLPGYRPSARLERDGILPVLVRFRAPPSADKLDALRRAGVSFAREGLPIASGAFQAEVDESALDALE